MKTLFVAETYDAERIRQKAVLEIGCIHRTTPEMQGYSSTLYNSELQSWYAVTTGKTETTGSRML
jgi:hypothetical protein